MRDVGEEVAQRGLLPLDFIGHLIEGLGQFARLLRAAHGDALLESAPRHAAGRRRDQLHRAVDRAREAEPDQQRDQQRDETGDQQARGEITEHGGLRAAHRGDRHAAEALRLHRLLVKRDHDVTQSLAAGRLSLALPGLARPETAQIDPQPLALEAVLTLVDPGHAPLAGQPQHQNVVVR